MRAKAASVPVHFRVEKFLRDRIRSGAFMSGDPVPPESQLCHRFSVSRMTGRA